MLSQHAEHGASAKIDTNEPPENNDDMIDPSDNTTDLPDIRGIKGSITKTFNGVGQECTRAASALMITGFTTTETDYKKALIALNKKVVDGEVIIGKIRSVIDRVNAQRVIMDTRIENMWKVSTPQAAQRFEQKCSDYWEDKDIDGKVDTMFALINEMNSFVAMVKHEKASLTVHNTPIAEAANVTTTINNTPVDLSTSFRDMLATLQQQQQNANRPNRPKVREITVPRFRGDYDKFESFWDMFVELIDSDNRLSDTEKIVQLSHSLRGNAKRTIAHITLVGKNYTEAKRLLIAEYDNKNQKAATIAAKFDNLEQAGDSLDSCRKIYSRIQALLVDCSQNQTTTSFEAGKTIRDIKLKFPRWVQLKVNKKEYDVQTAGKVWTVQSTMEAIDTILRKRAITELYDAKQTTQEISNTQNDIEESLINYSSNSYKCKLCDRDGHSATYCRKFKLVKPRRNKIRDDGKCFLCLTKGHMVKDCKSRYCEHCKGKHHKALCYKYEEYRDDRSVSRSRKTSESSQTTNNTSGRSSRDSSQSSDTSKKKGFSHKNTPDKEKTFRYTEKSRTRESSPHPIKNTKNVKFVEKSRKSTQRQNQVTTSTTDNNDSSSSDDEESKHNDTIVSFVTNIRPSYLMTAFARMKNNKTNTWEEVSLMLDSGAQRSYVKEQFVNSFDLPVIKKHQVDLTLFGDVHNRQTCIETIVQLQKPSGSYEEFSMWTQEKITKAYEKAQLSDDDRSFIDCNNISLSDSEHNDVLIEPDILIGLDYMFSLISHDQSILTLPSGNILVPTVFGYVFGGITSIAASAKHTPTHILAQPKSNIQHSSVQMNEDTCVPTRINTMLQSDSPDDVIKLMSDLDITGIHDEGSKDSELKYQEQMITRFNENTKFRDGKIYTSFFYNEKIDNIEDNKRLAYKRLEGVYRSYKEKPEIWEMYNDNFIKLIKGGILEEINEFQRDGKHVYYMPHHGVYNPNRVTTKLRIVYDASSHYRGVPSLNQCLEEPTPLIPELVGMLLRWRTYDHTMISDVESAFLNVKLFEEYRDVTRLLWLKDHKKPPSKDNIKILRHTAVPFGLSISPWLLAQSIRFGLKHLAEDIREEIEDNTYVDNVIIGFKDVLDGKKKYEQTKDVFQKMGLNLREYRSDLSTVNDKIPSVDLALKEDQKVLGLKWNTTSDLIHISCNLPATECSTAKLSKRMVLKELASVFDPMGYLTPLMTKCKIFSQSLWKQTYDWDDPLSESERYEWEHQKSLIHGMSFNLNRNIGYKFSSSHSELIIFVDASQHMAAAVAYLVTKVNQEKHSHLILSKQRLARLKKQLTLPKFELAANVMGVNMATYILKEIRMKIMKIHIMSDSTIALQQIFDTKKTTVFVKNRREQIQTAIQKIQDNYDCTIEFYHVSSENNAADSSTRGLNRSDFDLNSWVYGPTWLTKDSSLWEARPFGVVPEDITIVKDIEEHIVIEETVKSATIITSTSPIPPTVSSFDKHLRVLSYMRRFVKHRIYDRLNHRNDLQEIIRDRGLHGISSITVTLVVQGKELEATEKNMWLMHQREMNTSFLKQNSNLGIYKDDNGIFRCKGRLGNIRAEDYTKHPILVMKDHLETNLLIDRAHVEVMHNGVNHTLGKIRENMYDSLGFRRRYGHIDTTFSWMSADLFLER